MLYDECMLIEIFERRSPTTNRKSVIYVLECEACGKRNEGCKVRYERSKMHFCDNKCRGKYKHDHPETWRASINAMNAPEVKEKLRVLVKERAAKGEWGGWTGHHHTEETKRHLSELVSDGRRKGDRNGMFGKKHKESSKSAMSDAKTKLIAEGKFQAYGTRNKKGWYTSTKSGKTYFFRSSWEEAVMHHLDSHEKIATWDYECIRIPYYYDDHKRWYVPDFLVMFTDDKKQVWEVKPEEFLDTERVKNTTTAGKQYCLENHMEYVIVTRHVLKELGIYPHAPVCGSASSLSS